MFLKKTFSESEAKEGCHNLVLVSQKPRDVTISFYKKGEGWSIHSGGEKNYKCVRSCNLWGGRCSFFTHLFLKTSCSYSSYSIYYNYFYNYKYYNYYYNYKYYNYYYNYRVSLKTSV